MKVNFQIYLDDAARCVRKEEIMKTEIIRKNNTEVAVVSSAEPLITDIQSALDLVTAIMHETGCANIAINKEAIANDFFVLSACLAGEILQKFINYGIRFAIYGYTGISQNIPANL